MMGNRLQCPPLENYVVGALTGPEVLGGMSLDALIACAVDLGLVDRGDAATAGHVDPKFGPTVWVLDDALDHLAAEVSYLIEGFARSDRSWVQHVELDLVDVTDGIPTYADRSPSQIFGTVTPLSSVRSSPWSV